MGLLDFLSMKTPPEYAPYIGEGNNGKALAPFGSGALPSPLTTYGGRSPLEGKAAFDLLPVGVQGRPQYPSVDINSLIGAYERNEIVYAAINRRASSAIGPRLTVQRRGTGANQEWTEVQGHPMRRLIMRPNSDMDEASFLKAIIVSLDVAGVFYAEIVRAGAPGNTSGPPIALHPLNPQKIAWVPAGGNTMGGYEFREPGAKPVMIPSENVLVKREWSLRSKWQGLSPLAVCLGTVDADNAQTDFVRAFFNNAGTPSGILKVKGSYTQDQSDAVRAKWRDKYGRSWGRQHDLAVLDDNAEYQQIGSGLDQLDSETLRSFTESRVCMVFDVPPLIIYAYVGLLRSTYSNLREAWKGFWDATLTPLYEELKAWLTWSLLREFEPEEAIFGELVQLKWDMKLVPALRENAEEIRTAARADFEAGGITLNEFRAVLGEQPDPMGDYYLRKLMMVATPSGTNVAVAPAAPAASTSGGKSDEQTEQQRELKVKAQRRSRDQISSSVERVVTEYLRGQYEKAASGIAE